MKKLFGFLCLLTILAACSNDNDATKEITITKAYVEDNAEVGLTYDEVRERFGQEELSDVVDHTETWLYDVTSDSDYEYEKSLEVVAFEEIMSGHVDAQLYINFFDEKAFMYSYFYLGDDGKVWQYQVIPDTEPLEIPVSSN